MSSRTPRVQTPCFFLRKGDENSTRKAPCPLHVHTLSPQCPHPIHTLSPPWLERHPFPSMSTGLSPALIPTRGHAGCYCPVPTPSPEAVPPASEASIWNQFTEARAQPQQPQESPQAASTQGGHLPCPMGTEDGCAFELASPVRRLSAHLLCVCTVSFLSGLELCAVLAHELQTLPKSMV